MEERISTQLFESERNIILENVIAENIPIKVSIPNKSVIIESRQLQIIESKIILVTNPSEELISFTAQTADVHFCFSGIDFCFKAKMMGVNAGVAFAMPVSLTRNEIKKIVEDKSKNSPFAVTLFYETYEKSNGVKYKNKHDVDCIVRGEFFTEKPLDIMKNIMQYLSLNENADIEVPEVIFVSPEKIALAFQKKVFDIEENFEFAAWIKFPLKRPLNERKIYISFTVEKIYEKENEKKFCALGKITAIKLEDLRFLLDHI